MNEPSKARDTEKRSQKLDNKYITRSNNYDADSHQNNINTKKSLKGIITLLMLLDQHERLDQEEKNKATGKNKLLFEDNHKKMAKGMVDYYSIEFITQAIILPGEGEIMDKMQVADPDAVHVVRYFIRKQFASELKAEFRSSLTSFM